MRAGIITQERGAGVDRKKSREDLGEQEKKKREVQGGARNLDSALQNHFQQPRTGDNNSKEISQEHFIKLKKLKVPGS